jgi:hypothetical protein
MLSTDDPRFANWDQDATALEDRYAEQEPEQVMPALRAAARHIADVFADVPDFLLTRTGSRSDGAVFTVESLGRYFVHDLVHHAWDISRP